MRLRTRIGLLTALTAVLWFAGFLALRGLQQSDFDQWVASRPAHDGAWLSRVVDLQADALRALAERAAGSASLAAALRAGSPPPADWLTPTALASTGARVAWLLDPGLAPAGTVGAPPDPAQPGPPLQTEALRAHLTGAATPRFFAVTPAGVLELVAAPVATAGEPAAGYLLVGRLWDGAFLDALARGTGSPLALLLAGSSQPARPALGERIALPGLDGVPVALLELGPAPTTASGWRSPALRDAGLALALSLLVAGLAYGLLRRWVNRPLALIEESLRNYDPEMMRDLDGKTSEFVKISRFIDAVHGERSDMASRAGEQRLLEARLMHIASHDSVTDLPNRALFLERLEQALALARRHDTRLALILIDLDRFKHVNETLGHAAGDRLLRVVAQRIAGCVQDADLLARLGGDEFVVCLQELDAPDAAAVMGQRILERIATPALIDGQELVVTASLGISLYPEDAADAETLVKHADSAMYRAKDQGRGTYQFFDLSLRDQTAARLTLESSLRRALEREELSLLYQPRVELASGRINAAEALIRWKHPRLGLLSPEQFISLAEEIGLIVPIGQWMMRAACAQNLAWQRAGLPPVRVAVNVSARQFRQESVSSDVIAALEDSGLAPRWLELELTEGLLVHSFESTSRHVTRLRELGVSFAIDDFGVGYSALSYLRRLPIDIIKVDRSFVQGLPDEADDAALVDAIIRMAHGLRLRVVAEGVETAEQADLLRRQGCDEIQGYYVSRPLPPEELASMLRVESEVRRIKPVSQPG